MTLWKHERKVHIGYFVLHKDTTEFAPFMQYALYSMQDYEIFIPARDFLFAAQGQWFDYWR
jgi:hypothetical protein